MISSFAFTGPPEIYFGSDSISILPDRIKKYGKRILLVFGNHSFQNSKYWGKLQKLLNNSNIRFFVTNVNHEPTPQLIDETTNLCRKENIDIVVSIGGGSVMDTGKAISAMLTKTDHVKTYLESVGNKEHDGRKLPFIALPTTSGTGSEVTKNAVVCERGSAGYKKSLRHDNFIPDIAIIDPELTISCPKNITAVSGLDAFSQLLESYTSTKATIITDSLAINAIKCINRSLIKAYNDGFDIEARSDMAYASTISGITLSNAGLGLIHGIASSIGGYFEIPHGVICGILFGVINRININKLIEQDPGSVYLRKYAEVGRLFSPHKAKNIKYYALSLVDKLEEMIIDLEIPKFSEYGIHEFDIERIIASSGHKNNPVKFEKEELKSVLMECL